MSREVALKEVWAGFVTLMNNPRSNEESFHKYMVTYPTLIPIYWPSENIVYSKFKLGAQHTTDFAFCRMDTPGVQWHLIEIEKPKDRLFTKDGNPSARLTHAIRQCLDWRTWFEENREYIANNFPRPDTKGFFAERIGTFRLSEPQITIIMGRRQEVTFQNIPLLRHLGGAINIRTFDSLERNLYSGWSDQQKRPLRCCSFGNAGAVELSRMEMDIRFHVETPSKLLQEP